MLGETEMGRCNEVVWFVGSASTRVQVIRAVRPTEFPFTGDSKPWNFFPLLIAKKILILVSFSSLCLIRLVTTNRNMSVQLIFKTMTLSSVLKWCFAGSPTGFHATLVAMCAYHPAMWTTLHQLCQNAILQVVVQQVFIFHFTLYVTRHQLLETSNLSVRIY